MFGNLLFGIFIGDWHFFMLWVWFCIFFVFACFRLNQNGIEHVRLHLALVPPKNAPSDGSSSGSDYEVIIQNLQQHDDDDDNITHCSSKPRSYPSSLNELDICSHNEDHQPAHFNPVLLDEETIPLSLCYIEGIVKISICISILLCI